MVLSATEGKEPGRSLAVPRCGLSEEEMAREGLNGKVAPEHRAKGGESNLCK